MPIGIYVRTEETRRKLSEAKKGKPSWNKGKNLTAEHRKKLSLAHTGVQLSPYHRKKIGDGERGEKHYRWKGGVTPEQNKIRSSVEYKLWVNAVYARDGYICQKTGQKGGKLVAHHILNFSSCPELRFAIDNGVTLSKESHEQFHKLYGKRNNTREQLEEFLTINI